MISNARSKVDRYWGTRWDRAIEKHPHEACIASAGHGGAGTGANSGGSHIPEPINPPPTTILTLAHPSYVIGKGSGVQLPG